MLPKQLTEILDRLPNISSFFEQVELISILGKPGIISLLPLVGYALFIASLGDFVYLLFPLKLQNPAWELETLGALVEQCWGFLISLCLIFSRYFDNQSDVRKIELIALKLIGWLVLGIAIMFILSTPLIIFDTVRLYQIIPQQIGASNAAQLAQIRQVETQLDQVSNPKTLMSLSQAVGLDAKSLENAPPLAIKNAIKQQLTKLQNNVQIQIKVRQQEQTQKLLKSSFRTLYSGLVMSFIFILIWLKIRQVFWGEY